MNIIHKQIHIFPRIRDYLHYFINLMFGLNQRDFFKGESKLR